MSEQRWRPITLGDAIGFAIESDCKFVGRWNGGVGTFWLTHAEKVPLPSDAGDRWLVTLKDDRGVVHTGVRLE